MCKWKTTSSFPWCFPAENPHSGKKANLCDKAFSSLLVISCRTGKSSTSAEQVKTLKCSGCRNNLLSGEAWTPVAGRCSSCIGLGKKQKNVHLDLSPAIASSRCLGKSCRTKPASSDKSPIDSSTALQCRGFTGQHWYFCL